MKIYHLAFILLPVLFSCQYGKSVTPGSSTFGIDVSHHQGKTDWKKTGEDLRLTGETIQTKPQSHVQRKDTLGLTVLYPKYTRMDLVCGTMPEKSDTTVILVAEAAFTGQLLDTFNHRNVAGDHVSAGKRERGYACGRNTGAFVAYKGKWEFCYQNYSKKLDEAALHGGMGFGQEMIIHNGEPVATVRRDSNKNQFRALSEHDRRLCIIESDSVVRFGDFKKMLLRYGVTHAIYLDMGSGWNHAWYRDGDKVRELHPKTHGYCTNWITFYR